MSMITAGVLCLVGGTGVVLLYKAFARGLKFHDDFTSARRDRDA